MRRLALFCFIDAFGWDILRGVSFLEDVAPHRKELYTTFGYSSAAVPSILTGRLPEENGHWSCFYYSPATSPFRGIWWLHALRLLPRALTSRGRVRHVVSKLLKRRLRYTGYFQIYNVPLRHLHLFDYSEKKDMFVPGGVNRGRSIFDELHESGIPVHVSDWRLEEEENLAAAERALASAIPRFAFIYQGGFDLLLHLRGTRHPSVREKIAWYDARLRRLLALAEGAYDEVDFYVFSDHGQADVTDVHDLKAQVEALPLRFGKDYVAMYDSTMFRCWFHDDHAEEQIRGLLTGLAYGRVLEPEALRAMGAGLGEKLTGDLVFLLDEGQLIAPSFMGEKPVAAMHGYHPDAPGSYGMVASNRPVDQLQTIRDMHGVMLHSALEGRLA
jgi:hypothetical protein